MIPILVLKTENKVIYNKSNLNCKTFFEEFICIILLNIIQMYIDYFCRDSTTTFQITSPGRLTEGLHSLANLQELVVIEPLKMDAFINLTTIRSLKLLWIPKNHENWKWLGSFRSLEEIVVSPKSIEAHENPSSSTSLLSHSNIPERITIEGDKAEFVNSSLFSMNVFNAIPSTLHAKVRGNLIYFFCAEKTNYYEKFLVFPHGFFRRVLSFPFEVSSQRFDLLLLFNYNL